MEAVNPKVPPTTPETAQNKMFIRALELKKKKK
jgi:hypothetical protein